MKTEVFEQDQADAFLAAVRGGRAKGKPAASILRAGRAPSTGLTPLLVAGWSLTYVVGRGFHMRHYDGRETGWEADEVAVCQKAKQL